MTGRRSTLSHLRILSCLAYVKSFQNDKLGSRSDKCSFVGYPKKIRGYYFYYTNEQKMFVSNRMVFLENKFLMKRTNITKIELDEVRQVKELTQTSENIESNLIRSNSEPIVEASLRRSDREHINQIDTMIF